MSSSPVQQAPAARVSLRSARARGTPPTAAARTVSNSSPTAERASPTLDGGDTNTTTSNSNNSNSNSGNSNSSSEGQNVSSASPPTLSPTVISPSGPLADSASASPIAVEDKVELVTLNRAVDVPESDDTQDSTESEPVLAEISLVDKSNGHVDTKQSEISIDSATSSILDTSIDTSSLQLFDNDDGTYLPTPPASVFSKTAVKGPGSIMSGYEVDTSSSVSSPKLTSSHSATVDAKQKEDTDADANANADIDIVHNSEESVEDAEEVARDTLDSILEISRSHPSPEPTSRPPVHSHSAPPIEISTSASSTSESPEPSSATTASAASMPPPSSTSSLTSPITPSLSSSSSVYGRFSSLFSRRPSAAPVPAGDIGHGFHRTATNTSTNSASTVIPERAQSMAIDRRSTYQHSTNAATTSTSGLWSSLGLAIGRKTSYAPTLASVSSSYSGGGGEPDVIASSMEFLLNQIERQNQLLAQDPRAQGYDQEYRERYRMSLDKAHARAIMDGVEDGINWEFWGMLINDYDNMVKKHGRLVTQHIHEGIPESIRGAMWQNIAQSKDSDLEERYAELLGQEAAPQHDKLIKSDVPRTFSSMELFRERGGPGQERMYNVLKAYSLYDPEVGYCQGLSFIAAALLIYMPDEEAFCLMVRLMFAYDLRGHFTPDMYKLHLRLYQLDKLVEELLPAVHRHFILEGIRPTMFASQWFMTLFAYRFPLSLVARILDIVLAEGVESIFRFALALLRANQQAILEHTFDNLLAFVNHSIFDVYSHDPSQFVRDADEIHIVTAKRLAKYADEYEKQRQREEREKDVLVQLRNQNTQLDQSNKSLQNTLQQLNQEHCDLASQFVQLKLELQRERELSEQRAQKITDLESKLQGERQAAEDALKSDMEALANKNLELAQRTNDLEDLVHITQDELIGVKLKYAESEDQREQLQRKFSELRRTFGDV